MTNENLLLKKRLLEAYEELYKVKPHVFIGAIKRKKLTQSIYTFVKKIRLSLTKQ